MSSSHKLIPLEELKELWTQLGDIPTNNEGDIDEPFLHFPIGTFQEDIWHWFEEQHEEFSIERMQFWM